MRILIVRIGAMGDVLHAMPAVAALRERHPDWFLSWAIDPVWGDLLAAPKAFDTSSSPPGRQKPQQQPLVDSWTQIPTRDWKRRPFTLRTLRDITRLRRDFVDRSYDLCVDMQGTIRSAIVGRMAGAVSFVGPAEPREAPAAWLYRQKVNLTSTHVVDQGCELLAAAVGEVLTPARVNLPINPEAQAWGDNLLQGVGPRFVVLAPTAGWGAKQWPPEHYGAVAAELARAGYRILVNASSPEDQICRRVVEASGGVATLVPSSIGQLIALLRRTPLVIAGDTGPLHLAAALERPVVALFGPTDPARNGPYATKSRVLRHSSSQKDHSRRSEPEQGLMQITTHEVVEASLDLLSDGQDKVKL